MFVNIVAQACAGQLQDSLQDTFLQPNARKYSSAGMRRTVCRTRSCGQMLVNIVAQEPHPVWGYKDLKRYRGGVHTWGQADQLRLPPP